MDEACAPKRHWLQHTCCYCKHASPLGVLAVRPEIPEWLYPLSTRYRCTRMFTSSVLKDMLAWGSTKGKQRGEREEGWTGEGHEGGYLTPKGQVLYDNTLDDGHTPPTPVYSPVTTATAYGFSSYASGQALCTCDRAVSGNEPNVMMTMGSRLCYMDVHLAPCPPGLIACQHGTLRHQRLSYRTRRP
jgi:hypothetical protein